MHAKHLTVWFTYMVPLAISVRLALDIDMTNPHIYTAEQNDYFANKVLQIASGWKSRILDSVTQKRNGCEEIRNFDINPTHQCLIIPETLLTDKTTPVKQFGLSINEDSRCSQINVVRPSLVHECYGNSSLNSTCYNIIDHHQQISTIRPAYQECTKKAMDLVFLIDGSGSMTEAEFNKNKDFIVKIMNNFKNSSVKFAAVQFSSDPRKVFDFNDYREGRALRKLMEEPQMRSLTNTYRALTFVLDQIFESPEAGASPDAQKVLVLITDGDSSDLDRNGIINRYDEKNIIGLVIAVRDARLDRLSAIASVTNNENNAFKIENYDGLTGILEDFRKKVLQMEEAHSPLCLSGTSAVFYKVCSPSEIYECNENSNVNSVCFNIKDGLQPVPSLTPAFQVCKKRALDLVFLIDGSGSMTYSHFNKNKNFIVKIMNSFKNSSVKFAAVQFSSDPRKIFDFNDYREGRALGKLMEEPQMRSLTNTYRALTFVLDKIFESPEAGASPDALKVLVLITDGDSTDLDRNGIINRYYEKNIISLVIGVRDASLDRLSAIASVTNNEKNVFKIENYDGLTGILEDFQKKIFQMEEAHSPLCLSGTSAVFYKDTLIMGPVGSNSWRGSLQNHHDQSETKIKDPHIDRDFYIGYSISIGVKYSSPLYFMGAPTFEHTGQVILFRHDWEKWTAAQRLIGDQIGSYFGAELCSLDVDSDGNTDFVLVGAPRFSQEGREGQIYVYAVTDEMQLISKLNVSAPSMGRFGTTISSLADLNGDGLPDVAVGAPLEDDNRGAVYIYLGDRDRGIRSTFSHKVRGMDIKPELRYFGHAIDGDLGRGEDGFTSIVVGSLGTAFGLRYKPGPLWIQTEDR